MGNCTSTNENKQELNPVPVVQEKKIKIDPSKVLPAPQFKMCGADNLNITPHEINPSPVEPNINNNINNVNLNNNMNYNNVNNIMNNNNIANNYNISNNPNFKDY